MAESQQIALIIGGGIIASLVAVILNQIGLLQHQPRSGRLATGIEIQAELERSKQQKRETARQIFGEVAAEWQRYRALQLEGLEPVSHKEMGEKDLVLIESNSGIYIVV